jgi:hypothetical protein
MADKEIVHWLDLGSLITRCCKRHALDERIKLGTHDPEAATCSPNPSPTDAFEDAEVAREALRAHEGPFAPWLLPITRPKDHQPFSDLTREEWTRREHDYRDSMNDDNFWAYVLGGNQPGEPDPIDLDEVSNQDTPCTECGERGACGYDTEGRPMFHRQHDDDDDEQNEVEL